MEIEQNVPGKAGAAVEASGRHHVLLTANMSWNLFNFRKGLIRGLIADGHEITALAPLDDCAKELEALGCRVVPLTMDSKSTSIPRDAGLLVRFVAALRSERPDIVFGFTIKNNIYGSLAANLLGIPFVPTVTGLGTAFLHEGRVNLIVRQLYRHAFRRAPAVFFQNEDDEELFLRDNLAPWGRTNVLPGSGIDLKAFAPAPPPARPGVCFLLIARLLWDKGVGDFVEAARLVRRAHPEATFVLLGPAGAENRTAIDQQTVDAWVAEGVVTHAGAVDDVRPFIAQSDCVVLPSFREGTPRTLLEASAMARPLIATDVPGCRSVLDDGKTGFLCRVKDPADLARQMMRMIEVGAQTRAEMGAAGRMRMEQHYDQAIVFRAYKAQIERLTKEALRTRGSRVGGLRHGGMHS